MTDTLILSAQTQTVINKVIDHCLTVGYSITLIADKLTKEQLVAFIDTTSRALMETQITKRSLAKSIVAFLYELSVAGGKGHYQIIRDKVKSKYGMTVNDYSSLKYWGLIQPVDFEDQNGFWEVTTLGKDFLLNKIELPKQLTVHNDKVIDRSEKTVKMNDFDVLDWVGYKRKKEFNYSDVVNVLLS